MSARDEELRRLAETVAEWSNCNKAWLDTSEDVAAAVVGHIDEDGNTYPVVTVDCELYYSGDSLALAKFYAAANPATVLSLLDEIERLRAEVERLQKDASRYQFIRAGGAYVEPSDNSLYVALDERGKYYDDRRDLDMDIDEAIATQGGE